MKQRIIIWCPYTVLSQTPFHFRDRAQSRVACLSRINDIVATYLSEFIPPLILLWRKFICGDIGECNVNKSWNRLYFYAPKVEYHLQFISSLAGVKIKCNTPHPPTSYFRNNMPFFSERALGRSSVHAALRQGTQRTQGRGK